MLFLKIKNEKIGNVTNNPKKIPYFKIYESKKQLDTF